MSAVPKPFNINEAINEIFAPVKKPSRFERLSMLCDEIAMFRPTYEEAMDIASSLEQGLQSRFNDDLSSDVLTDFRNLNGSLDESDTILLRQTYEPDPYNSEDQDNK